LVHYQYDKFGISRSTGILSLTQYVCQKGELVLADDNWLFSVKDGGTGDSTPHELVRKALKRTEVRVGVETAEALNILDVLGLTLHPECIYQQALSGVIAFRAEGESL
jgi:hypothetical protein